MTVRFVRSGATFTDGLTWAGAYQTLAAAVTASTNADTIYVSDDHAESTGAAVTITCPSTPGLKILCASQHASETITALATSATVSVGAAAAALTIDGHAYIYGITFNGGTTSSSSCVIRVSNASTPASQMYEQCDFVLSAADASLRISMGPAGGASNDDVQIVWKDCGVKFANGSQSIKPQYGRFRIFGLTIDGAGSTPTSLFLLTVTAPSDTLLEASDLTGESFTNLVSAGVATPSKFVARNCKLPASVVTATGTIPGPGGPVVEMHNCSNANPGSPVYLSHVNYAGAVDHELTIIRTSGASDGTTGISWKMVTSAGAQYPSVILRSPEIVMWNTSTSAQTATIEIVHDSQGAGAGSKFNDDEIWLELQYQGTAGSTAATIAHSGPTNVLDTGDLQPDSSVTWTTTGLTSPVKQKLQVPFTAGEVGFLIATVCMAKASKTAYIDPVITLT